MIGNLIGTNAAGTAAIGNILDGMRIDQGTTGNTIGGTTASARNIISGNARFGILITDSGTSNNAVQGNYIGTDVNGTADLGNISDGIHIQAAASNNTIGGTTAGAGNVISGNDGNGITVTGSGTNGNTIAGNLIGTNASGSANNILIGNDGFESPNLGAGFGAYQYSPGGASWTFSSAGITAINTAWGMMGATNGNDNGGATSTMRQAAFIQNGNGTTSGRIRRTLSGFVDGRVFVSFGLEARAGYGSNPIKVMMDGVSLGTFTPVNNNSFNTVTTASIPITAGSHTLYFLGTNNSGDNDSFIDNVRVINTLGNAGDGIAIANGSATTIGGTAANAGNVISGNVGDGLRITGNGSPISGAVIQGNLVGVNLAGNASVPNGSNGVEIINSQDNTIGGATIGAKHHLGKCRAGHLHSGRVVDRELGGRRLCWNRYHGNRRHCQWHSRNLAP